MTTRTSKLLLRGLVLVTLGLAIGGPTPGYVGGCNTTPTGADPEEFCRQYETRVCARENALRPNDATYMSCVAAIPTNCAGRNWQVGCAPTQSQANACLEALVDASRISTAPELLGECIALCPGSGGGVDPEGI